MKNKEDFENILKGVLPHVFCIAGFIATSDSEIKGVEIYVSKDGAIHISSNIGDYEKYSEEAGKIKLSYPFEV